MLNRRQRVLNSNDGSANGETFNARFNEVGNASGHHFNSPSLDLHVHPKLRDRLIGEDSREDALGPLYHKQHSQKELKPGHLRLPS